MVYFIDLALGHRKATMAVNAKFPQRKSVMNISTALFVLLLSAVFGLLSYHYWSQAHAPVAPEQHPYVALSGIWSEQELDTLSTLWQNLTSFQTMREETTSRLSHIGEATPPLPDGSCPHPYLIPRRQANRTDASSGVLCILPERIDVAHHHFLSGGVTGRKERFEGLVPRLLAFQKIFHTVTDDASAASPAIRSLFDHPTFRQAAAAVCPQRPLLDPIQLGIIVLVPGQEVALHYDVPWFAGATRYDFPQWLLIVMQRSHLFDDLLWPQVQTIAYIHRHNLTGGAFSFWNDGPEFPPRSRSAVPNTGLVIDGSRVPHAVEPLGRHAEPPLAMTPHHQYELRHDPNQPHRWQVWQVDHPAGPQLISRSYATEELRVSLVWRARCFKDAAERASWHDAPKLSLAHVLHVLQDDLRARGVIDHPDQLSPLELALLLLKTYIQYPYSDSAVIPYNYCMLGRFSPLLSSLATLFCRY
jgi:hypothetical protein